MDDNKKPGFEPEANGQKPQNGGASFFDQKKDDASFAPKPVESGAKSFFDSAAPKVEEGEIVSPEVKSEKPEEPHGGSEAKIEEDAKDQPFESASENFVEKLRDTLVEAGINMQKVRSYFIGCVIFAVIVVVFIFGGMKGYRFLKQKFEALPEGSGEVSEEISQEGAKPLSVFPEPLGSALLLGQEKGAFKGFPNPSLSIAYELGAETERFQKRFVQQVEFLNEMRSTVKTDVFRLLDQSRQREKALADYMTALVEQENEGRKIFEEIDALIRLMEVRFTNAVEAKTLYETRFFEFLKNLQGRESDEMLQGFIEMAQEAAEAKAEYNALSKLKAHYETVLRWISTRRTTIDLNTEALIKGVKVVGVEGSDLELILTPESLSKEVEE